MPSRGARVTWRRKGVIVEAVSVREVGGQEYITAGTGSHARGQTAGEGTQKKTRTETSREVNDPGGLCAVRQGWR